ncbi:MAG: ATP-dependent Clp protease adaptor ClpS [Microscillaceae bacterium]|nr:ATP-dependent Clp protease adaptor ClpS [Microscillaceae bacterium]MDW8460048.1 ATP-dependent Clp protease adaptor ClpS [Cytophagales bacterium]
MFWNYNNPGVEELIESDIIEDLLHENRLVIHNDDYNTFDYVIYVLMKVLNHTEEQAEQCALIAHYKGKCAVKEGSFDDLKIYRDAINEHGIKATIE